ncbi:MAG: heme o synthase [Saprospiraceae bacterium]
MQTKVANKSTAVFQKLEDYKLLVKFKLNLLVVFSAVMAYLIAATGTTNWLAVFCLGLGGFLVTGAANALNQVLERNFDKDMKRTENRPLATGRMTVSEAVMAAGFMSLVGITILALFNPWTAFLGTISMMIYAFIYTPMKRVSNVAVLIGAIPGALPTMIGCVAIQGELTALALVLFAIQFMWQFPHFWAIAWVGYDDYANAGFYLLPSKDGARDKNAGLQSLFYALPLIPLGMMPYLMGVTGLVSAILLSLLAIAYAYFAWDLYKKCTKEAALRLMFSSFVYLPMALIVLLADKI